MSTVLVKRLRGDVVVRRAVVVALVLVVLTRVVLHLVGVQRTRELNEFLGSATEGSFSYSVPAVELRYLLLLVVALTFGLALLARGRASSLLVGSIVAVGIAYIVSACFGPVSWLRDATIGPDYPRSEVSGYVTMIAVEVVLGTLLVGLAVLVERSDQDAYVEIPQVLDEP